MRLQKEVRHELVTLPMYNGFQSNSAYKVEGGTVTLLGQVTRPTLKLTPRERSRALRAWSGSIIRLSAAFSQ